MASIIELHEGFVIGNGVANLTKEGHLLLSAQEMRVKNILTNPDYYTFHRLTATAQSSPNMESADYAVAIYTIPERLFYGDSEWNHEKGNPKQNQNAKRGRLVIDHTIGLKTQWRRYDLDRLKNTDPSLRGELVAKWTGSITENMMFNLELYFLKGVIDNYIARSKFNPDYAFIYDTSTIKTQQDALDLMYKLAHRMTDETRKINASQIGTNTSDWEMIWEPHSYLDLTRAYTQLIGENISANTMVTGTLFQDKVMGYMISKSLWLGQEIKPLYGKTSDGQLQVNLEGMNRTRGFDLSIDGKIEGLVIHRENAAMITIFTENISYVDNDTQEPAFTSRVLFSLPALTRPELGFLIVKEMFTEQDQNDAIARLWDNTNPTGDSWQKYNEFTGEWENELTYQLLDYDPNYKDFYNPIFKTAMQNTINNINNLDVDQTALNMDVKKKYHEFFGITPSTLDTAEIKKLFDKVLDNNLTTYQKKQSYIIYAFCHNIKWWFKWLSNSNKFSRYLFTS
ncbi:hypothetical protein [Spiroplasma citri]|uniref:Uncharacterized protein n=1 Tax=Spiroplasma citri TaxID=2133 RepID=A0AAJ4JXX5_SPICI|nr:hypothetical protein [Spiroplasma citri]APE74462.1 hypothetical protein SCITRI_00563 [Spiroplasma citri]QIA66648.1 hypothetical protein GMI18_02625 [Spiroplasma citri]QIA68532.1 hypothetical protein GL298_02745 [Spiroplasma citri]QIA70405.1 hypothetical protein GL981_02745 [Spiroplasma citri]QIA72643.1 hypothetical protein GL982_02760 [Spiroplasma citri]